MPVVIPLIALAAAAKGVHSGVKGAKSARSAAKIADAASKRDKASVERLTSAQDAANALLDKLGHLEADIVAVDLARLVTLFSLLRGLTLSDMPDAEPADIETYLIDTAELTSRAVALLESSAAGVGAGAFAGFAAYGAVGALGTASTGTAIGGLSGAAAQSATLAWLGGGSIAAGGGGIAAGTMVLGAVVAAPAVLVGGVLFDRVARKNLANATAYQADVNIACASRNALHTACAAIQTAATTIIEALADARGPFNTVLDRLAQYISIEGTDYGSFSPAARKTVHEAFLFGQVVKALIDTPILGEEDKVLQDYKEAASNLRDVLNNTADGEMD